LGEKQRKKTKKNIHKKREEKRGQANEIGLAVGDEEPAPPPLCSKPTSAPIAKSKKTRRHHVTPQYRPHPGSPLGGGGGLVGWVGAKTSRGGGDFHLSHLVYAVRKNWTN